MKTVEEKAKECIDNLIDSLSLEVNYEESNYDAGQVHALSDYGKEIYKVGFLEGQSNPKIKQLEWEVHAPMHEVHGSIHYVNQYNPIGYTACITEWNLGKKDYSVRLGLNDSNNSTKFFNSIDEAKDFVQKDFEKRVKECLITE
jgi:hypothetical protein